MKLKNYNSLTWAVYNNYGGRKKQGIVAIYVDVNTKNVYPIPIKMEHINFLSQFLGKTEEEIREDPLSASHLVPSVIEIRDPPGEVIGLITGTSGAEMAYGIRHTKKQLEDGHAIALYFIENGELPIADDFKKEIVWRWLIK